LLAYFVDVEVGNTLIIFDVAGNEGKLMVKLTRVRNDEEVGRAFSKDMVEQAARNRGSSMYAR
jgi:hypothetical protein